MTKFQVRSAFWSEVEQELAFLEAEGFAGPVFDERSRDSALYASRDLAIEVGYVGGREPSIATTVWSDDREQRADLSCLYVEAGLGPPQEVGGTSPRTSHSLHKAIASEAAAIRKLLPLLKDSSPRRALLARCDRGVPPFLMPPPRRS
jgi:hypothetical protein